jgi:hypothetical protein
MTISEQLTQLNTNLDTINTEVSDQADIIAQIKSVLTSAPAIDGSTSNSATPVLFGSHTLRTGSFSVGKPACYDNLNGIYTYFYEEDDSDNGSWVFEEIAKIDIRE